jgi:hypothetical protein
LGLFFSIDEFDAGNDFGDQFHRLTFELLLILFLYLFLFHGSLHLTLSFRVRQIGGASPLVRWVRSRTVAKVDSMGLVVRYFAKISKSGCSEELLYSSLVLILFSKKTFHE